MKRHWTALLLLAAGLVWASASVPRHLRTVGAQRTSRIFYVVDGRQQARFIVGDASELHVAVSAAGDGPRRIALTAIFMDAGGRELARAPLSLQSVQAELRADDGTAVSRPKVIRLCPPAGAAMLVLTAEAPRLLVRVARPSRRHASISQALRRAGVDAAWLAPRDALAVRTIAWQALPALEGATVAVSSESSESSDSPTDEVPPTGVMVSAHRAGVWNVVGPGKLELTATAPISATTLSADGLARHQGNASQRLSLPIGATPTSAVVRASGDTTEVRVEAHLDGARPLGGTTAALHASGWIADGPLRFALAGTPTMPLRLTLRHTNTRATARATWRFVDATSRTLMGGALAPRPEIDTFAAIVQHGRSSDIGVATVQLLVPPAGAAGLEIDPRDALVQVQARAEAGSDTRPAPPYDEPLSAHLRWVAAPARIPEWIALKPLSGAHPAHLVGLMVAPHLETRAIAAAGASRMVAPADGGAARAALLEPGYHGQTATLLGAAAAKVRIAAEGAQARRLTATCELHGQLGGELRLLVDGAVAARAPADTGRLRLVAAADPGARRVQVVGHAGARCSVDAPSLEGPAQVLRSVFAVSSTHPLRFRVRKPAGVFAVHVALYAERPLGEARLAVDGGHLRRHAGAVQRLTSAERTIRLNAHDAALLLPARRPLERVGVARVLLGDDLPAGPHTIELTTPQAAWARAWAPGTQRRAEHIESYTTSDEEP